MAATKYLKFTGKVKWAKVYQPDEFRGTKNFSINQYLDDDQLKTRSDAGVQSKVYEDEDGKYVTWKRPETKLIKGVLNKFSPPKIYDHDGKVLVSYEHNEDNTDFVQNGQPVLIGNGSVCTVTVAIYDTSMGAGQRLESVQVDDLIVYESAGNAGSIPITSNAPSVKAPW